MNNRNLQPYDPELRTGLSQLVLETLEITHEDLGWSTWLNLNIMGIGENWNLANALLEGQKTLKTLRLRTNCSEMLLATYGLFERNRNTLTSLDLDISKTRYPFNFTSLHQLVALTHMTFTATSAVSIRAFFPPNLKSLTWEAPLGLHWYVLDTVGVFPSLEKMTLATVAQKALNLDRVCYCLFGLRDRTITRFQELFLVRPKLQCPEGQRETRSWAKVRAKDFDPVRVLPREFYRAVYNDTLIKITRRDCNPSVYHYPYV
jgi:hypothetical protein